MDGVNKVIAERLSAEFFKGLRRGVEMYAHWKDGVQYVGTCGKTLKDALADINKIGTKELDDIRNSNG
jgi:hypothetical protein